MATVLRAAASRLPWLVAGVLLAGAAIWGWSWLRPAQTDMTAVMDANLRGIGYLDRFDYPNAVLAFQEVVRMAPDWTPGKVNLAIALLNFGGEKKDAKTKRQAIDLLEGILKTEPKHPHANQCLGIMYWDRGMLDEARDCFRKVTQIDPDDADAWCWLGRTLDQGGEEYRDCMTKAVELNPYHGMAAGNYQMVLRVLGREEEANHLMERVEKLRDGKWFTLFDAKYSAMGKYAMPIGIEQLPASGRRQGPLPLFDSSSPFEVKLARETRWANGEDFGPGEVGDLYRAVRQRFGAPIVVLDYNGDGKPDLFLPGAVMETVTTKDAAGKELVTTRRRDLLLRNGKNGQMEFIDVTKEAGLADHPPSFGAFVADYDNDGRPDLLLTSPSGVRLFRNTVKDKKVTFTDVTKSAGLDSLTGVYLGAAWLDLDQDGDLDLVLCRLADSAGEGNKALAGEAVSSGSLVVLLNAGEAKPEPKQGPHPSWPGNTVLHGEAQPQQGDYLGLTTKFARSKEVETLFVTSKAPVNLALSDLDHDRDLDVLAVADQGPPTALVNDRLLQFHKESLPEELIAAGRWNGALVLDSRQKDRNDLFLISPDRPALLLLNDATHKEGIAGKLKKGITNAPALRQARAIDLDLDGLPDIVGLSAEGKPVFIHNDGERLVHKPNSLGMDSDFPADCLGVAAADFDRDGHPDLVYLSEQAGLGWRRCMWNGNHSVEIELIGRRYTPAAIVLRTNTDGVGVKLRLHAGTLVTGGEVSTMSAGLGQSYRPLLFGIGQHKIADMVRLRWPDNVWQGEMSLAAGQRHRIYHTDRMPSSCPLLFTWDGERYVFVADFLGGGAVGEPMPDRSYRAPRPEESVKIETRQLKAQDGRFVLKLTEPMDEVTYLDRLQLVVVDHPAGARVYPEERFHSVAPSQDLHGFLADEEIHPLSARDHKGRDVTQTLRHVDRNMVDGFARRYWLGYAEDHHVQLDFGDQLAKYGPKDRVMLCVHGWTDYPYPEAMWAATQAGVPLQAPTLERQKADGTWEMIVAEVGFPAGRPRMVLADVTGKVHGSKCVLRLKTNMQVYGDQIFLAPVRESAASPVVANAPFAGKLFHTTTLPVARAELTAGRVMQEYSPDGKQPTLYDFHKHEPAPVTRLAGKLTRFGEVTELLHGDDDRFVIFGAGDELTVMFDASKLPPLPKGWTRSFVLRTAGYCKSASSFGPLEDTVEPLPFRAMSNYPYGAKEHYPQTPMHQEYLRKYQTRAVGAE